MYLSHEGQIRNQKMSNNMNKTFPHMEFGKKIRYLIVFLRNCFKSSIQICFSVPWKINLDLKKRTPHIWLDHWLIEYIFIPTPNHTQLGWKEDSCLGTSCVSVWSTSNLYWVIWSSCAKCRNLCFSGKIIFFILILQ